MPQMDCLGLLCLTTRWARADRCKWIPIAPFIEVKKRLKKLTMEVMEELRLNSGWTTNIVDQLLVSNICSEC